MIAELTDQDLLSRMRNFEDHFVERKTSGDYKDWTKTVVAFANSAPLDYPCVLFIGVKDDGTIESPQVNLDTLQKSFNREMDKIYPPPPYLPKIINDADKQALAVIVLGSSLRPHFAGPAYIRKGSETEVASEEAFQQLVQQRLSKVRELSKWLKKPVTVQGTLAPTAFGTIEMIATASRDRGSVTTMLSFGT